MQMLLLLHEGQQQVPQGTHLIAAFTGTPSKNKTRSGASGLVEDETHLNERKWGLSCPGSSPQAYKKAEKKDPLSRGS